MKLDNNVLSVLLFREEGLDYVHSVQTAAWFERFSGPVKIETVEESVKLNPDERGQLVWSDIFSVLSRIRSENNVPEKTFIVLLTHTENENNWFAVQDKDQMRNGFIHFDDYRWMTNAPSEVISVHFILKGVYNALLSENKIDWTSMFHDPPRGCLFDFCSNKLNFKPISFLLD